MMERNQKRSHLTVIDGNVYQIRKPKTKSKQKFNLGNGVVNPDGTYQKRIRNKNVLKKDNEYGWQTI
jgi:hypothetical protein